MLVKLYEGSVETPSACFLNQGVLRTSTTRLNYAFLLLFPYFEFKKIVFVSAVTMYRLASAESNVSSL